MAVVPITVVALPVAGSAFGLSVPGVDAALHAAGAPALHDTSAHRQPHAPVNHAPAAPTTPQAPAPGTQPLSSGQTLTSAPPSPSPSPTRTEAAARPEKPAKRAHALADAATHAAATSASASASTSPTASSSPAPPAAAFRVASFNMLGASHTGPGSERPSYASGATRTPWAVQLLNSAGVTVAGLQEFQTPQIQVFNRVATGWHAWPGLGTLGGVNSVIWRTGTWQPVQTHTIQIPYFGGQDVPMPYVLLRNISTGKLVWFANFHNPADAHGPAQRWRDEAVAREVALVNRLQADGTPVIVTGDFNDRDQFFCPLANGAGVTSADGSHASGGSCTLAPNPGVDWVVGTHDDLDFADFHRLRGGLVARTSDHPFVWAQATAH